MEQLEIENAINAVMRPHLKKQTEILSEVLEELKRQNSQGYTPYQVCPKCGGSGLIFFQTIPMSNQCDVCFGSKIIVMAKNAQ